MGFKNNQLQVGDLPSINEVNYTRLEKEYRNVLFFNRLIFVLVFTVILVATYFIFTTHIPIFLLWIGGGILIVFTLTVLILTPAVFKVKSYALRQRDIMYRSGLLFRSTTVVPFNRVQHVELKTSPIDRMFKLSRLKIYTAGGSQSDLTIPGISPEKASRIKEMIIAKTAADEEE
jgi:membrane protein YdbS with pleckstrin-like domain